MGTWDTPWTHVDVLGKPAIHRFMDSLSAHGCESVSIAVSPESVNAKDAPTEPIIDFVTEQVKKFKQEGFETILITHSCAYVEFDIEEMLEVHQQEGKGVTRLATKQYPLGIWMLDTSCLGHDDEPILPALQLANPAIYRSQAYVNPLGSERDFRRLVVDSFSSRCRLRPEGVEIRPGVWVNDGAQIERSARIVAPAFIGAGVQISEECLVTRCSNIESASFVDFGTAVEDSSILPDTYIGIGLDLSHSIVDGCNLFNLRHDVLLDITDPVVVCRNTKREVRRRSSPKVERRELAFTAE